MVMQQKGRHLTDKLLAVRTFFKSKSGRPSSSSQSKTPTPPPTATSTSTTNTTVPRTTSPLLLDPSSLNLSTSIPAAQSGSQYNPYAIVAGASPGDVGRVKDAVNVTFEGFKTTLRALKESSDVFPPLKAAVAGLLTCIDGVEQAIQNKEDLVELDRRFQAILGIITQHSGDNHPNSRLRIRIDSFSLVLEQKTAEIKQIVEHNFARRVTEGSKDAGYVTAMLRTMGTVCETFLIDTALSVERNTDEIISKAFFIENSTQDIMSRVLSNRLPCATKAPYNNTSDKTLRRACTENTRTGILDDLCRWASDPSQPKIYWLNGMAGTGKTTIAYSFCERLSQANLLGATFFCSRRIDECAKVEYIFPTIAHGLTLTRPSVILPLLEVLKKDADAGNHSIAQQFTDLLVTPVKAAAAELNSMTTIVVIDALDECADQAAVQSMLSIVSRHLPHLPIKFFVTSRPEQAIRRGFKRGNRRLFLFDCRK